MENEVWLPIKNYGNKYEISNKGQVRTVPKTIIIRGRNNSLRPHPVRAKIKIARVGKNGYVTVALWKDNKTNNEYLHRIIGEAFIKKPEGCDIINHKNGIKNDNRIENLEWCTSGYNNQHAITQRLRRPANACINEKIALQINEMRKQKYTLVKIAKVIGISKGSVGSFVRGESYKYLNTKAS